MEGLKLKGFFCDGLVLSQEKTGSEMSEWKVSCMVAPRFVVVVVVVVSFAKKEFLEPLSSARTAWWTCILDLESLLQERTGWILLPLTRWLVHGISGHPDVHISNHRHRIVCFV